MPTSSSWAESTMRNDLDDVVLLDVDHAERGEQENNLARKKTDVVGKRLHVTGCGANA